MESANSFPLDSWTSDTVEAIVSHFFRWAFKGSQRVLCQAPPNFYGVHMQHLMLSAASLEQHKQLKGHDTVSKLAVAYCNLSNLDEC